MECESQHPVGRQSGVWQALLDIRDARQEHRLVSVPRISAENIFVPVVRGRAELHDIGGRLDIFLGAFSTPCVRLLYQGSSRTFVR
jgi:hypothetical protein